MSPLDLSRLSGPDAVAALRSYPRRYRGAILPVNDPETEELAYRMGPSGHTAVDLVTHATNTFVLLGQALSQILQGTDPVLHPGVTNGAEREWTAAPGLTATDALDRFETEAGALADIVAGLHLPDSARTGRVAGGSEVTTMDIAKEAVQVGAADLDEIKATLAAVG